MKKVLLGTTAIVAAGLIATAPSAQAAEKLQAKVGGYMEQWLGYTSQDAVSGNDFDGLDQKSDGEIHFKGSTTLDNGVSVGINVQLEANTGGDMIDESYMIVKGSFGEINIGSENSAQYKMHYAPSDYGIGLNSGDQSDWVSTTGIGGTTGTFRGPFGSTYTEAGRTNDANRLTYYTPRIEGFQLGLSYVPNNGEDSNSLVDHNSGTVDGYSVGANYQRKFGSVSLGVSGGYGTIDNGSSSGSADPNVYNLGFKMSVGGFSGGISYAAAEDDASVGDMNGVNIGVAYASGPWGVSLAYFEGERNGNTSALAATGKTVHLSAKYALGPGVTLAGTLGRAEFEDVTAASSGSDNSGTYLVAGLKVSF